MALPNRIGSGRSDLQGKHVVIYGNHYWPEPTGNAPYTTGIAEHLVALGAQVSVVTAMPHYPQWRVYDKYRGRLRLKETIHGVEVHRFLQFIPDGQNAILRAFYEGSFLLHALLHWNSRKPDAILGIMPTLSSGLLAALAAWRHGVPFGLVLQDLMGPAAAQSSIDGGRVVSRLTGWAEGIICRRADRVGIVADAFRLYLEGHGIPSERIEVLRNWSHVSPPSRPREQVRTELGWPQNVQIVLHAGNMGLKQGLEHVVKAARVSAARTDQVRFVLMGDGNQRKYLESLASDLDNVVFMDPQPNHIFMDILAAADVLLVNERESVKNMSLPSKLTSYFRTGRPVVGAVSPEGATAIEIKRSRAGLVISTEDPETLLSTLARLAADHDFANSLGQAGPEYVTVSLNPEEALARVETFVRALSTKRRKDTSSCT